MNPYKKILMAAMTALLGAILADLDAWKSGGEGVKFDWKIALRRYAKAVAAGILSGAGISATGGN